WVAERKDVLSAFFGFLSLLFYACYVQILESRKPKTEIGSRFQSSILHSQSSRSYVLALCFFALGLMSKPMLVTWPFVMLLLDYWPLRRFELPGASKRSGDGSNLKSQLSTFWRLVAEKIPFFALAVVASVVTFVVQKQ